MSIVVDATTLTTTLWPLHAKEAALRRDGQFLHLHVASSSSRGGGSCNSAQVTCFAFDPRETTRAVLGTSEGRLYGVDLRDNRLFLLADSGSTLSGIRVACFVCLDAAVVVAYVTDAPQRMSMVEWSTGRQQDVVGADGGVHRRPIATLTPVTQTRTTTTDAAAGSARLAMLSLSADMLCCWAVVSTGEEMSGNKRSALTLRCVARATPAQAMTKARPATAKPSDEKDEKKKKDTTDHGAREPAGFIAAHACLAADTATATSADAAAAAAAAVSSYVVTVETNGVVARWRFAEKAPRRDSAPQALQLERCLCTLPFRAACSAWCGDAGDSSSTPLLLLGGRQTSAVAVLRGDALAEGDGKGACAVQLPPQGLGVRQLVALSARLVACVMGDGRVLVLCRTPSSEADAALSYRVAFALDPPCIAKDKSVRRPPGLAVPWRFYVAAFSFAAYCVDGELYMLHLPTARRWWQTRVHAALQREERQRGTEPVASSGHDTLSLTSGLLSASAATTMKTVAVPFMSERYASSGTTRRQSDTNTMQTDGGGGGGDEAVEAAAQPTVVHRAGPGAYYTRRSLTPLNTRRWVPVQLLPSELTSEATASSSRTATTTPTTTTTTSEAAKRPEEGGAASQTDRRTLSGVVHGLFSEAQSVASFCYNMDRLRDYLGQYGSFPSAYRASIWRFVLGLPGLRVTAPQYAALARRPVHLCVEQIMAPFPLPAGPARTALEAVVSGLAWHSPVFAMASFLPALAYPLLRVYRNDAQAVLELLLTFFINWGKDFFTCYPRSPTRLFVYLERVLRREDGQLAAHLQHIGAHADIWGWEAVLALYTDYLSAAEWLQVMDHAFMMNPMWLFLFHLCHLLARRAELLQRCHNAQDVLRLLHTRAPDLSLDALLPRTYALYDRCAANVVETVRDYFRFYDFGVDFVYPTVFACDETVVRARVQELDALAAQRQESAAAAERLARLRAAAEAAALREELLFQQQSARVAAKYDASARSWYSRVQQERTRQALEAQERAARLAAVSAQRSEAARLGEWETAMDYAAQQLRHDRADRELAQTKWRVGAALTNEELTRQEQAAQERLAAAMARVVLAESDAHETSGMNDAAPQQHEEEDGEEDEGQESEEEKVHAAQPGEEDVVHAAAPQASDDDAEEEEEDVVVLQASADRDVKEEQPQKSEAGRSDAEEEVRDERPTTEAAVAVRVQPVQRSTTPCSPLQERYEALHRHVCAPSLSCGEASTTYGRPSTSRTADSAPTTATGTTTTTIRQSRTLYDNLRDSPAQRPLPSQRRTHLLAPTQHVFSYDGYDTRRVRAPPYTRRYTTTTTTTTTTTSATRTGAPASASSAALSYHTQATSATTLTDTPVTRDSSRVARSGSASPLSYLRRRDDAAQGRPCARRQMPPPPSCATWTSSATSHHAGSVRSETPLSSVPAAVAESDETSSDSDSSSDTSYEEDASRRHARRSRDDAYWQRH